MHNSENYREIYAEIIKDAFKDDEENFSRLMEAIDYFNENDHRRAAALLNELESSCASDMDRSAVLMFKALSYSDQGKFTEAIEIYNEVVKIDEKNTVAWSNLAIIYDSAKDNEKALNAYLCAIKSDPCNACVYNNLSSYYLKHSDFKKSLENALMALRYNSSLYQAMGTAAVCYAVLGDAERSDKYKNLYVSHGGNAEDVEYVIDNIYI